MARDAAARDARARRPFWLHQVAEYLLGIILVALGLQMPDPLVPALAGLLVLVNAAVAIGPASAFRVVGRRTHRVLDLVVIGAILVLAVQPWLAADGGTRGVMVAVAAVLGVVWYYTDFAERSERRARRMADAGQRPEEIGRTVGRMAGDVVNRWRRRHD